MSWMQLLAVSKSIGTVLDRPSPYKMRQQNLLPRFGQDGVRFQRSERPPERETARPEAGKDDLFGAPVSDTGRAARLEEVLPGLEESAEACAPEPAPVVGEFERVVRARAERRLRWWIWRGRSRRVRREGGTVVQGELGLGAVQVVRNDLMEDDLLVRPARQREEGPSAPESVGWWRRWWRKGKA